MNKSNIVFLILVAALTCSNSQAQSGGFGHFYVGPAIGNYSRLQRDLQQYHLLGPDFGLATTGFMVGGGGMVSMNGLLIGGSGFATQFGSSLNSRGEAEITTGGGFFNLGYAMHNQNGWLLYPYLGIGGLGTELVITNNSPTSFTLDAKHSLQPGEKGKYTVGGIALEGGFGLKKLIARKDHKSGLVIGVDFGTYGLPAFQNWTYEGSDRKISGLNATHSQAYYVRFSFGGGWFY